VNNDEARTILRERIARLREQGYEQVMLLLDHPVGVEVVRGSGNSYNVEIEAMWDHDTDKMLRVCVSIDDGSLFRSVNPLSDDFIVLPDGSFVGE
jgi:hypothetical protein